MKDELGGKMMKKIVALRTNMHIYLTNDGKSVWWKEK